MVGVITTIENAVHHGCFIIQETLCYKSAICFNRVGSSLGLRKYVRGSYWYVITFIIAWTEILFLRVLYTLS
jgi:hypothetical protein